MSDSRILHELAGAASLCWNPKPTGVFNTEAAIEHVEIALRELRIDYAPRQPVQRLSDAQIQEAYGMSDDEWAASKGWAVNSARAIESLVIERMSK